MLSSADKVVGWVKKGQKHADVILERPLGNLCPYVNTQPHFRIFGCNDTMGPTVFFNPHIGLSF